MISDALRVFMKNMKNIHGGVLLLIKSLASTCNSTNNNTPTRVIFTFSKYSYLQRVGDKESLTFKFKKS